MFLVRVTHVKRQEENKEAPAHAALSPGAHSTRHPLELLYIHLQDKNRKPNGSCEDKLEQIERVVTKSTQKEAAMRFPKSNKVFT